MTHSIDKTRTPFVWRMNEGWALFLIDNKQLEWGHRFDADIGYRVFVKWADSEQINAFPPALARAVADKALRFQGNNPFVKELTKIMKQCADQCQKLNDVWALRGAKDQPLDQDGAAGHA